MNFRIPASNEVFFFVWIIKFRSKSFLRNQWTLPCKFSTRLHQYANILEFIQMYSLCLSLCDGISTIIMSIFNPYQLMLQEYPLLGCYFFSVFFFILYFFLLSCNKKKDIRNYLLMVNTRKSHNSYSSKVDQILIQMKMFSFFSY